MSLSKEYFASTGKSGNVKDLWLSFEEELREIQAEDVVAFSSTLLGLFEIYASHVPAFLAEGCDISLYAAIKMTAALAVCLYDDAGEQEEEEDEPVLLVGADFSGIQSYIYQIVSKYAGKNLKGRSYYLRILSDAVVRYLLKQLALPEAAVVYNSGGGFYLLAPNTASVKLKLAESIADIERLLHQAHGVSLFVAIDSVPVSKDALLHRDGQNLQMVWKELFLRRDRKKKAKFATEISKNYQQFFVPFGGANVANDVITGDELSKTEIYRDRSLGEDAPAPIGEQTAKQILIGRELKEMEVVLVSEKELPFLSSHVSIRPASLGFHYYFLKRKELEEKYAFLLDKEGASISVITYNGREDKKECCFLYPFLKKNRFGLAFYGGNTTAKGTTFEDLCKSEGDFTRLGVLRMDVDNLGSIFQGGIPAERANLARFAELSRSFDYFFSGYLNRIQAEEFAAYSTILYSGGDDLFIVGKWDVVIRLAERIRDEFRQYTCNNPAFSISGGIAILTQKYPIMKGAAESGEEEERAKGHYCREYGKNSISFMGMPLNWDKEYPLVKGLKDRITAMQLGKEGGVPSSFRNKVVTFWTMAKFKEHRIQNMKVYWMIAYTMARMKERLSKDNNASALIQCFIDEVCKNAQTLGGTPIESDYHPLELWAFAARWAELELRTNEKK